jgi:imidazolonepropionase-like amidohydrolase
VRLGLAGLTLWDGVREAPLEGISALRIEGERIAALGGDEVLAGCDEVRDLRGAFALPGLIDAHVHLTLGPAARVEDGVPKTPEGDPLAAPAARARAMVEAGITTARDLGGGAHHELALRDRIAAGELPGPRLLCAGQPVTSPRGHCWFWGGEARGADEIRAVVRRQVVRGADWIKVMATGGVFTKDSKPSEPQFAQDELDVVVAEASAHGRAVAAHCHGTQGIERAARAGVRTIEHCSFATEEGFGTLPDPELVARIAKSGVFVSPTIHSGYARFYREDGSPGKFASRMGATFAALRAVGVPFIASTDAGIPNVEHHRLPEGLAQFARLASLRPVDVLRAATSDCARALGLAELTGRIAPGLCADLLIVDGDPLADLGALLRPVAVFARGRHARPPS